MERADECRSQTAEEDTTLSLALAIALALALALALYSPSPSPKTLALALALALALQYYPYCRGGPNISEGVQILQYYPEVFGPGGPKTSKFLDRGSIFSRSIWTGGPFFS